MHEEIYFPEFGLHEGEISGGGVIPCTNICKYHVTEVGVIVIPWREVTCIWSSKMYLLKR
jgi:hypothetical protein